MSAIFNLHVEAKLLASGKEEATKMKKKKSKDSCMI